MKQPIRLLVLAALAATVAGTAIAADTTGATTEDTKGHGVYSGKSSLRHRERKNF